MNVEELNIMVHFVVHKLPRDCSIEDSQVVLLREKKLKNSSPKIREYGLIIGWLLSFFRISLRIYNQKGQIVYIHRKHFLAWLYYQRQKEQEQQLLQTLLEHKNVVDPFRVDIYKPFGAQTKTKKTRVDFSKLVKIFSKEMALLQTRQGDCDHLTALYDLLKEELLREIEYTEEKFLTVPVAVKNLS